MSNPLALQPGFFPDVPSHTPLPSAQVLPPAPLLPTPPPLTEREKSVIISQRAIKYEQYVELLRETLNKAINMCKLGGVSDIKIKNNLSQINNLVEDIKTIDRNMTRVGGKKNKRTRVKNKKSKRRGNTVKRHM